MDRLESEPRFDNVYIQGANNMDKPDELDALPEYARQEGYGTASRLLSEEEIEAVCIKEFGAEPQPSLDKDQLLDFILSILQIVVKAQLAKDMKHEQARVDKIATDLYEMLLVEEGVNYKTPIIKYLQALKKREGIDGS